MIVLGGVGHSFVVDGIKTYSRSLEKQSKELNLYHCKFGWSPILDGYYLERIFDNDYYLKSKFNQEGGNTSNALIPWEIDRLHYYAINEKPLIKTY